MIISLDFFCWWIFVRDYIYHGIHHSKSHHERENIPVFFFNFLVTTYRFTSCQRRNAEQKHGFFFHPRFGYIIGINGNVVTEVQNTEDRRCFVWFFCWRKNISKWSCKKSQVYMYYSGTTPHAVRVPTRIIPFLVGTFYKPSFVTVTGWEVDRMYITYLDENI